jgi:hypothetical protein
MRGPPVRAWGWKSGRRCIVREGEESLYTPIVLRTGFMHSYRRTIPLLLSVIMLAVAYWTAAGFWSRFDELGLMRWGLIAILSVVVPIGTGTIRDIVAGYANLFGVFDKKTEEKLKPYKRLTISSLEARKGMRRLFRDDDTYAAFQRSIRRVVFDKTTDIVIIATVFGIAAFVLYNTVYEKTVLRAVGPSYPLLILELFIDAFATAFLILALSYILMFGVGYFYSLSRLGRSRNDLSIWNYVQYLRGIPVHDRSFVSY